MHDVSMVLISQDSTLASVVQEVVARTPGIRLERVQDHDEACDRVASRVLAVLSHLTPRRRRGSHAVAQHARGRGPGHSRSGLER